MTSRRAWSTAPRSSRKCTKGTRAQPSRFTRYFERAALIYVSRQLFRLISQCQLFFSFFFFLSGLRRCFFNLKRAGTWFESRPPSRAASILKGSGRSSRLNASAQQEQAAAAAAAKTHGRASLQSHLFTHSLTAGMPIFSFIPCHPAAPPRPSSCVHFTSRTKQPARALRLCFFFLFLSTAGVRLLVLDSLAARLFSSRPLAAAPCAPETLFSQWLSRSPAASAAHSSPAR